MARPFMPWYIGDYLRDTGHLTTEQHGAYLLLLAHCWQHGRIPLSAAERAAIAKLTPRRWKAICEPIDRFFQPDGTHSRVTREIERTEVKRIKAKAAGHAGGIRSGIVRAIKRGSDIKAELKRTPKQEGSERFPSAQANDEAETKRTRTNHKESKNLPAVGPVDSVDKEDSTAGSLATALPTGALARPPTTEAVPSSDPRISADRAKLEASMWLRRKPVLTDIPVCPCCFGWKFKPVKKIA